MTRENHEAIIRRTVAAIHQIDPQRGIVIDGLEAGNLPVLELADLPAVQSGRGYQPMPVTHYEAGWWPPSQGLPFPKYPGTEWAGKIWDREALRVHYQPWRDLEARGVGVHVGEFGCYNKTPQDVALRWFSDLLSVFKEFGWGYALWNFEGPFGIVNHGRTGARSTAYKGFQVDMAMFELYLESRLTR